MSSVSTHTPQSNSNPQLRVELRSNALLLSGVREMVASVAKRLGFSDETCGQISLAVDEALCNVIRHGYNRRADQPIWLSLYAHGNGWDLPATPGDRHSGCGGAGAPTDGQHPESIRIVIEDEARQVDPAVIKSRDLDEVRPGGLGVHIIKSVMDEVRYERREAVGMRLTMVKNRLGPPKSVHGSSAQEAVKGTSAEGGRHG